MLQERLAKHMGCRLEGLFCVTENGSDPGQAVPRGAVVCQRRFRRERPLAVDDRSQLLVIDIDGLAPSSAVYRLSARTIATVWPTKLTSSRASGNSVMLCSSIGAG